MCYERVCYECVKRVRYEFVMRVSPDATGELAVTTPIAAPPTSERERASNQQSWIDGS